MKERFFIIGDIHGNFEPLQSLIRKILKEITPEDRIIFLGDYIDRGVHSFEVVELLLALSKCYPVIFLKGNHEDMMLKYLKGAPGGEYYLVNGGIETIRSYKRHCGSFTLPEPHREFFENLDFYFEGSDFIAVHAGLHPARKSLQEQQEYDMIWIRDIFYHADKKWEKTVIFGHTPVSLLKRGPGIYIDDTRNIIAMDNGIIYGNPLACLRWPDRKIFYSA